MKIVLSLLLLLASDTQFVMAEEVNDTPYSQCTIYYQTKLNNHLIKEEKGIILVTNDDKKEPFVTLAAKRFYKGHSVEIVKDFLTGLLLFSTLCFIVVLCI